MTFVEESEKNTEPPSLKKKKEKRKIVLLNIAHALQYIGRTVKGNVLFFFRPKLRVRRLTIISYYFFFFLYILYRYNADDKRPRGREVAEVGGNSK